MKKLIIALVATLLFAGMAYADGNNYWYNPLFVTPQDSDEIQISRFMDTEKHVTCYVAKAWTMNTDPSISCVKTD